MNLINHNIKKSKYGDDTYAFEPLDRQTFLECLKETDIDLKTLEPKITDINVNTSNGLSDDEFFKNYYVKSEGRFSRLIRKAYHLLKDLNKKQPMSEEEFEDTALYIITDKAIRGLSRQKRQTQEVSEK